MSKGPEIRCYDYVNHPYERVRDALRDNSVTVFQSATKAAAYRAQSIDPELHVDVGGIGVQTDIRIPSKASRRTSLMLCRVRPPGCCSNGKPRPSHTRFINDVAGYLRQALA